MYVKYLIGSLFSLFLLLGGLWPGQSDFFAILLCLVPANICYFILMGFSKRDDSILFYMLLAIALRVGMLFTSPHLSDDYVRFIWDGHLSNITKNPYEKKPVDQISSIESNRYIYLYSHLNSPNYHTVYPPFLQAIFKFSVRFGENNLDWEIFFLKIFYAIFSIGLIFLLPYVLKLYGVPTWHSCLYTLNPLVIIEEMGNLHAEGIMVFFLALFLFALKKYPKIAFIPYSAAIAVKLNPLLLLPSILMKLSLKYRVLFSLGILIILFLFFLPYLNGIVKGGFFESLYLYVNKLEFNAFGYNIFKAFGYMTHGYNRIKILGPLTAFLAMVLILFLSNQKRNKSWDTFPIQSLILYFIYLFFSPVIHPWYIIPLVFFAIFNKVHFVFIWSALSVLSYSHYIGGFNKEQYLLIFFQYFVVLLFLGKDMIRWLKNKNSMTS